MLLLDRLRTATFKGVEFLVENSSISFGQKTVVHQYPNSDRTEVEFLGQSEDIFTLDIYINSIEEDYIGKRNLLKDILNSSGAGLLVHPYEGEVRCSVVDKITLVENDRSFGLARFSVTFQKTSLYLYPTNALDNITKIRNLYVQLQNAYKNKVIDEYYFDNFLPENFIKTKQTLSALYHEFEIVKSIVPLNKDQEVEYNKSINTFNNNINSSVSDPNVMAESLDNVITNIDGLATNEIDNIEIYKKLYEFGGYYLISPELTAQAKIVNGNYRLISNYINIIMLGLSYNSIALIKFETDEQLNSFEALLESQYNYIFLNLDSDIAFLINSLRNEITKFFNSQDVRRVITKEVTGNPLVKLCYLLYENTNDYEKIYNLNNKISPIWYEGNIRVLTN